jgi:hypothetical protein
MFRRPVAALSCALLFALAVPAAATPVTLSQGGSGAHGQYGRTALTISNTVTTPGGSVTDLDHVSAGAFDVKSSAPIPGLDPRFAAWCLDISRTLHLGTQYQVTTTPFFPDPILNSSQRAMIRALFNVAFGTAPLDIVRPLSGSSATQNHNSAGFQLALWEVVNETSGTFSLGGGTFSATGSTSANTQANTFLTGAVARLTNPTGPDTLRVVYLQSLDGGALGPNPDSQSLVAFAPVPVPAAGALLLAALAGLGLARRRQVRNT